MHLLGCITYIPTYLLPTYRHIQLHTHASIYSTRIQITDYTRATLQSLQQLPQSNLLRPVRRRLDLARSPHRTAPYRRADQVRSGPWAWSRMLDSAVAGRALSPTGANPLSDVPLITRRPLLHLLLSAPFFVDDDEPPSSLFIPKPPAPPPFPPSRPLRLAPSNLVHHHHPPRPNAPYASPSTVVPAAVPAISLPRLPTQQQLLLSPCIQPP